MVDHKKMRIKLRSYDHELVDQSSAKIVEIAKRAGAKINGPIPLPTEKKIITVLRSTQVNKDSREQFEMRTHKRLIDVLTPSSKAVEMLSNVELPAGVDIGIKL